MPLKSIRFPVKLLLLYSMNSRSKVIAALPVALIALALPVPSYRSVVEVVLPRWASAKNRMPALPLRLIWVV